ncbi:MAG: IclR family transcriptional regulator [Pseudomonadota bacterium]
MYQEPDDPGGTTLPTNLRLLLILEEIARLGVPVHPSEVRERLGLPKPTIHRLFATLEAEGFLTRDLDGRSYSPGRRLRKLSVNVLSSLRVRTARVAVLTALAEDIGETCNIAIPDRDAMIYLERVETKWPLRIQLPIGSEVPFYCTASGKMYLSTLNERHLERYVRATRLEARTSATITEPNRLMDEIEATRSRGFAEDDEEFMESMIALAMPIYDDQQRLVSTVSFHAPAMRLSLETAREHVPRLRQAADELARLLLLTSE